MLTRWTRLLAGAFLTISAAAGGLVATSGSVAAAGESTGQATAACAASAATPLPTGHPLQANPIPSGYYSGSVQNPGYTYYIDPITHIQTTVPAGEGSSDPGVSQASPDATSYYTTKGGPPHDQTGATTSGSSAPGNVTSWDYADWILQGTVALNQYPEVLCYEWLGSFKTDPYSTPADQVTWTPTSATVNWNDSGMGDTSSLQTVTLSGDAVAGTPNTFVAGVVHTYPYAEKSGTMINANLSINWQGTHLYTLEQEYSQTYNYTHNTITTVNSDYVNYQNNYYTAYYIDYVGYGYWYATIGGYSQPYTSAYAYIIGSGFYPNYYGSNYTHGWWGSYSQFVGCSDAPWQYEAGEGGPLWVTWSSCQGHDDAIYQTYYYINYDYPGYSYVGGYTWYNAWSYNSYTAYAWQQTVNWNYGVYYVGYPIPYTADWISTYWQPYQYHIDVTNPASTTYNYLACAPGDGQNTGPGGNVNQSLGYNLPTCSGPNHVYPIPAPGYFSQEIVPFQTENYYPAYIQNYYVWTDNPATESFYQQYEYGYLQSYYDYWFSNQLVFYATPQWVGYNDSYISCGLYGSPAGDYWNCWPNTYFAGYYLQWNANYYWVNQANQYYNYFVNYGIGTNWYDYTAVVSVTPVAVQMPHLYPVVYSQDLPPTPGNVYYAALPTDQFEYVTSSDLYLPVFQAQ